MHRRSTTPTLPDAADVLRRAEAIAATATVRAMTDDVKREARARARGPLSRIALELRLAAVEVRWSLPCGFGRR